MKLNVIFSIFILGLNYYALSNPISINIKKSIVYICNGQYAEAYHSNNTCRGMNNCQGTITSMEENSALNLYNRRPCCICWDVKEGCKTDEISNIYTRINPPIPSFDQPNLSQGNPMHIIGMFKQYKYDSRKKWIQERVNGLVLLISLIINSKNIKCESCNFSGLQEIPRSKISEYIKGIGGVDFSDDYAFNRIIISFSGLEQLIYNIYAVLLRSQ